MIKAIDFVSLDTLGVKLFHMGSKGSSPICGMPKLICVFTGRMLCIIIMCVVHIVNMIRNGVMLIVECMKREIHDHFVYSQEYHFYKYYCYASHLSLTSAIITMFALQMSLKTTSR